MFKFENDLFCPGKVYHNIFRGLWIIVFMFENGMTEDYFIHLR